MKTWKKALSLTAAVAMTATMMPVSAFAADDETFKIGVIGPMTGDNAQYGLGVYHAAQVAAEEMKLEKDPESMSVAELEKLIKKLEKQMKKAAADLNFEAAAELRDKLIELKKHLNEME